MNNYFMGLKVTDRDWQKTIEKLKSNPRPLTDEEKAEFDRITKPIEDEVKR